MKKLALVQWLFSCMKCNNVVVLYAEHEGQFPETYKCKQCGEERYPIPYDEFVVQRIKDN